MRRSRCALLLVLAAVLFGCGPVPTPTRQAPAAAPSLGNLGYVGYVLRDDVWVKSLPSGEPQRLTSDGYNSSPLNKEIRVMKKSIQSVFLAFVVLTVLLSGCAPAPTPPPLQPASAIPTTAAATAAPSAARATPTLAAPAVVNPVALVGLAGATRIDILAFDSAPGAGAQPGYVQRLAVTDPATVGRILAALNVDMKSLPKAACIPEYELRFQLPGGAVNKLSYNCHDSSFLRGDQPAWAEYDAEAPAAFDQLMSELLAAPTPIPPTLTPSPMPIAAPAVSRTPSASVAGAPVTVVPPSSPTQYLEFSNLSDLQKLTKFPIRLPTYIPDNLPF